MKPPAQFARVTLAAARRWTLGEISNQQLIEAGEGPVLFIREMPGRWCWLQLIQEVKARLPLLVIFRTKCPGLLRLAENAELTAGWRDPEGGQRFVLDYPHYRAVFAWIARALRSDLRLQP